MTVVASGPNVDTTTFQLDRDQQLLGALIGSHT